MAEEKKKEGFKFTGTQVLWIIIVVLVLVLAMLGSTASMRDNARPVYVIAPTGATGPGNPTGASPEVMQAATDPSLPKLEMHSNAPVRSARTSLANPVYQVSHGTASTEGQIIDSSTALTVSGKPKTAETGWGTIDLVKISAPAAGYFSAKLVVVDVYSGPSFSPGPIGTIDYQDQVGIVPNSAQNGWVQIAAPVEGWIYTK